MKDDELQKRYQMTWAMMFSTFPSQVADKLNDCEITIDGDAISITAIGFRALTKLTVEAILFIKHSNLKAGTPFKTLQFGWRMPSNRKLYRKWRDAGSLIVDRPDWLERQWISYFKRHSLDSDRIPVTGRLIISDGSGRMQFTSRLRIRLDGMKRTRHARLLVQPPALLSSCR